MENGDIPKGSIQASSIHKNYYAWRARLNGRPAPWMAAYGDEFPWIQANVGYQANVSGIITQSDGGSTRSWGFVTSLKVSTFAMSTNDTEVFVTDKLGQVKVNCYRFLQSAHVPS